MADQETCNHEWEELDSQFNNENYTDVKCIHCGVYGEKDNKTDEVYWPVT